MIGRIVGTGSYIPQYCMDKNDIAKLVETSDEWIRERTGVARRHIISGEETTVSMASVAGKRALENAGIEPEEVDLILVSTISSNVILPCAACEVQKEIGAVNATCFDLNAACTGFILAYNTAAAYIAAGVYKTALIIGSESLSNLTNWNDRGTCILFGDGAGAAVLAAQPEASETSETTDKPEASENDTSKLFIPVTHSNGAGGEALSLKSRHDANGLTKEVDKEETFDEAHYMQMDGRAVFKFAVKKVPEVIEETLQLNKLKKENIACYILHQANRRIIESVAKRLDEPLEKFPMNLEEYGNTSSASIPILLDEWNRQGKLKSGSKIVLAGFGAGLTWGASVISV